MKYLEYVEGMRVKALKVITDGGDTAPPDFDAKTLIGNPGFVHAVPGDLGTVEYVDDDGCPTIRFDRKKTATVVGDCEVERISE